jgi:ABC-type transport system involved in cytochrome c biogenesis permease subunit
MDKTSIKTASTETGLRPSAGITTAPPAHAAAPQSKRPLPGLLKLVLMPLASLRLTVVLFVLALLLVFAGTLAQVDISNNAAVLKYFRSFYVWIPFAIFFPRKAGFHIPGGFPFPGGWLIGSALLVNLLAAHAVRFRMTWKRSGIFLLHAGLVCMMLGELVTGLFAVESRMSIAEGGLANYVEDLDKAEIVFTRPTANKADTDDVIAIPAAIVRKGGLIRDDRLPVDVVVVKYMINSDLTDAAPKENLATTGAGLTNFVVEKSETTGVDSDQSVPIPSAFVTFKDKRTGKELGTYLLSVYLSAFGDPPQVLEVDGTKYDVAMRFKRTYKPYTIRLKKFSHDLYDGTDIPRNYSSLVQLEDSSRGENREVLIWMNHPLRYSGDTFFQADFLRGQQRGTVLQVVRNPGWTMPYISCAMVAVGMMIHFGILLVGFIRTKVLPTINQRPNSKPLNGHRNGPLVRAEPADSRTMTVCAFVLGGAALLLLVGMLPASETVNGFDLNAAGKIAVLDGGRSKPLDTVARTKLMILSGKQTFVDEDGKEHSAMEWMLDVMTSHLSKNGKAEGYKVFRIENDEVLNLLQLPEKPGSWRYSVNEIAAAGTMDKFQDEFDRAFHLEKSKRKLFDIKVLEVAEHIQMYIALSRMDAPLVIDPPAPGEKPISFHDALPLLESPSGSNTQTKQFAKILTAYSIDKDPQAFNQAVETYRASQEQADSYRIERAKFEAFFNHFAPFYHCLILYVVVVILAALSWLCFHKPLNRAAFWLMLGIFIVHSVALFARMYIQERPFVFVTNLYSSAVFIGWVSVGLLLVVERIFPYGIASFLGGMIGFATLLIAHFLSLDGDTMEMLQAVLDTNFWLATHVTCVTIGYAATFVAGGLGMLYIAASIYNSRTGKLDRDLLSTVASYMLYGVVCFAMFFSFTGTVLGGIWADQSWGRFWGWDAKENGAVMIVIWNALILHARWAGLVKARGTACLAVIGNIITAWSWFGVNMLGVGMHTYGFMQGALAVLLAFIGLQVVFLVLGMLKSLHQWPNVPGNSRVQLGDA